MSEAVQFTMRVRKINARTDQELRALLEDEALARGLDPADLRYQTRSAYRLDSGTHIDYAFDVDVVIPAQRSPSSERVGA